MTSTDEGTPEPTIDLRPAGWGAWPSYAGFVQLTTMLENVEGNDQPLGVWIGGLHDGEREDDEWEDADDDDDDDDDEHGHAHGAYS